MKTNRVKIFFLCLFGTLVLAACNNKPVEAVKFHRLDQVLFTTPVEQLQLRLQQSQGEFATDLLTLYPDDPHYIELLQGFVSDPIMREIYRLTDSCFGSMEELGKTLGAAMARATELDPTIRYDHFYTYITGQFDYTQRVIANSHELLISLDQYVLPFTQQYQYFGLPLFLVQQSRPQFLPIDCMNAIASERVSLPESMTLLDYMVAEGKAIYFTHLTLPEAHDSLLLRYTADQLRWMEENEEHVWAYFLHNKVLYETDFNRFHNLIDDAPKTNAFRDSSPRTTDYIGYRIVSQYMKKSGVSLQELFSDTDAQKILQQSNYRPK